MCIDICAVLKQHKYVESFLGKQTGDRLGEQQDTLHTCSSVYNSIHNMDTYIIY